MPLTSDALAAAAAACQALFLSGNRVGELSEIDRITHLPALTELFLSNNPCARKPLYRPTTLRKLVVRHLTHPSWLAQPR